MLAAMIDGLAESGASEGAGAAGVRRAPRTTTDGQPVQERHQPRLGDVDPGDVLGRRRAAALDAAPGARQLRDRERGGRRAARAVRRRLGRRWRSPSPGTGSDSANIKTTAVLDGDEYVLNGEKIFVTSGDRADHIVVWATLDKELGRAAIKSFVVAKGTPGHAGRAARAQARHPGLRHRDDHLRELPGAEGEPARLGRGRPQAGLRRRDGDLRQHPPAGRRDGRRLRVGGARPDPRAARATAGVEVDYDRPAYTQSAAAAKFLQLESDWRAPAC